MSAVKKGNLKTKYHELYFMIYSFLLDFFCLFSFHLGNRKKGLFLATLDFEE